MRFHETITGIGQFLARVTKEYELNDDVWFRGQRDSTWPLTPSLARIPGQLASEMPLIKRFQQNALSFSTYQPQTEWDWLLLMQHHGAPTRLLDWTESILAALYFACEQTNRNGEIMGTVWCLWPRRLNALADAEGAFERDFPFLDYPSDADLLANYLPSTLVRESSTELHPIAVMVRRTFPRLAAQLGVFTLTHRLQQPIELLGSGSHVGRFDIPASAKDGIRRELAYLRITELTLFPELTSVARVAREILR